MSGSKVTKKIVNSKTYDCGNDDLPKQLSVVSENTLYIHQRHISYYYSKTAMSCGYCVYKVHMDHIQHNHVVVLNT